MQWGASHASAPAACWLSLIALHAHPAGCLHPEHAGFFDSPAQYLQWYERNGPVQAAAAPTVAVLLYRKHVITSQLYIEQLVRCLEVKGIRPVPIFLNGEVSRFGELVKHDCVEMSATDAEYGLTRHRVSIKTLEC